MITIQGKGVSKGIAKGPIYFFSRPDTTVTQVVVADVEAEKARLAAAQEAGAAVVQYGNFISQIINFVIMAFVVFLFVRTINKLREKDAAPAPAPAAPTTKKCPHCLSEIPIEATKCAHCTSDLQ